MNVKLLVNGKEIPITAERDPANLPHASNNIDVAVECTGFFTKREGSTIKISHLLLIGLKRMSVSI